MNKYNIFLILFVCLVVFSSFLIPGPRGANDFPYIYQSQARALFDLPYAWSTNINGLGQYNVPTLWSWPQNLITGLLSNLGIDFSIIERIYGVLLVLVVGYWGISKLFKIFKTESWGRSIGIIFFLTNTYLLLLIDGGQISIALSYAVMPLAFSFILETVEALNLKRLLLSITSVYILSFLDIRFIYILCILILIKFIFDLLTLTRKVQRIKYYIITGVGIGISLLLFHAYWILPGIISKAISLPANYTSQSQVNSLSFSTLGHSLLLQQPNWYKNIFGVISPLSAGFIIIPILVFLAPILRKKDRSIAFWLIVALVGVFLVKGDQDPWGGIYTWLFLHIPGFNLFRDPSKFYFLSALGYSYLIAVSTNELMRINFRKFRYIQKLVKIVPYVIVIYLLWIVRPTFLNEMTGLFATPVFKAGYLQLANYLLDQSDFSRTFWIPNLSPLGYSSPTHPSINASDLVQDRPFSVGVVGSYELFNFLREASYTGELFDVLGIGYIAYPPLNPQRDIIKIDSNSPDVVKYYNQFLDQLGHLDWTSGRVKNLTIPLLATKQHEPMIFSTPTLWWVIGSDSIYNDATKSAKLNLSKNAMIFAEEKPGLGSEIKKFPLANIVLNNKSLTDLAASLLSPNDLTFPASSLDTSPNATGWWKRDTTDLISWRNFLQTKYNLDNQDFDLGGGWAVAEGDKSLNVKTTKIQAGQILLARVMESSLSGKISFNQGNEQVGILNTLITNPPIVTSKLTGYGNVPNKYFHCSQANFHWMEVGELKNDLPITINTDGVINVVNALAIVNESQWIQDQTEAQGLSGQGRIKQFMGNINPRNISLQFEQINPTFYKIKVENLTTPTFIVFAQSYDPMWTLRYNDDSVSESSVPVYSLVNGFMVSKNGEYTLFYPAQQYVNLGLVISSVSMIAFLLLWFVLYKNRIFSAFLKLFRIQ